MAENVKKEEEKKVLIDWRGVLLNQERKHGIKISTTALAAEYNVTRNTLTNWDKEAPPVVKFLHDFIKNTGCTFEDLVKELQ